jgi:hypothetical protein
MLLLSRQTKEPLSGHGLGMYRMPAKKRLITGLWFGTEKTMSRITARGLLRMFASLPSVTE